MLKFNWKIFISFGLSISFVIIFLTGLVLYIVPPGRLAYWISWKFLFLTKGQWEDLHTVFSYYFVILSIFHLFSIHWKSFLSYLKKGKLRVRELITASFLSAFLFIAVLYQMQPVYAVMDFGSFMSDSWKTEENTAPVYHAEKYSLEELIRLVPALNKDTIVGRFNESGIEFDNFDESLRDIAAKNNKSPLDLYLIISR